MEEKLVSLVICSYNNWPDLELAIRSALYQSYRPLEVIVVDNGSTDGSAAEVARLFGRSIRFTQQENRRDSGAYNAGLRMSNGEFIQFLDGDDILLPHKIETQVAAFRQWPDTDVVYGDVRKFQSNSGNITLSDFDTWDYGDILEVLLSFDGNGAGLGTLNTLLSRRAIERIGEWDERLYNADLDYMIRAAWLKCRFRRAGGLVGFYRQRPGQMTSWRSAMLRGVESVWAKAETYVTSEPHRSILANALAQQRLYMSVSDISLTRQEALALWKLARSAEPNRIPGWAYAAARATILIPGAREFLMSSFFHAARRAMRGPLRYPARPARSAPRSGPAA